MLELFQFFYFSFDLLNIFSTLLHLNLPLIDLVLNLDQFLINHLNTVLNILVHLVTNLEIIVVDIFDCKLIFVDLIIEIVDQQYFIFVMSAVLNDVIFVAINEIIFHDYFSFILLDIAYQIQQYRIIDDHIQVDKLDQIYSKFKLDVLLNLTFLKK